MNRFGIVAACLLTLAVPLSAQDNTKSQETKPAPAVKQLTTAELRDLLQQKDKYVFLDVRETKELEEFGTVKNHVHIPLGELEKRMNELPKNKVIVTMCQRGVRAGKAADLLVRNGFHVVGACGLTPLREEGYKMVFPYGSKKG